MMMACLLLCLPLAQDTPIGSALASGTALVYESGGVAQTPWMYESVELVERDGFERCVRVGRREQPVRETCVRDGVLFEPGEAGQYRAVRPIGPGMRLELKTASGQIVLFETGSPASRGIGREPGIAYVPTTITTRATDGTVVRRLREQYAPALLTALMGEFEEPDGSGGWRTVRTFTLAEIRR